MKILPHPKKPPHPDPHGPIFLLALKGCAAVLERDEEEPKTRICVYTYALPEVPVKDGIAVHNAKARASLTVLHTEFGNRFDFANDSLLTKRNAIAVLKSLIKTIAALPERGIPVPGTGPPPSR